MREGLVSTMQPGSGASVSIADLAGEGLSAAPSLPCMHRGNKLMHALVEQAVIQQCP